MKSNNPAKSLAFAKRQYTKKIQQRERREFFAEIIADRRAKIIQDEVEAWKKEVCA